MFFTWEAKCYSVQTQRSKVVLAVWSCVWQWIPTQLSCWLRTRHFWILFSCHRVSHRSYVVLILFSTFCLWDNREKAMPTLFFFIVIIFFLSVQLITLTKLAIGLWHDQYPISIKISVSLQYYTVPKPLMASPIWLELNLKFYDLQWTIRFHNRIFSHHHNIILSHYPLT